MELTLRVEPATARTSCSVSVPTCPEWTVAALAEHLGPARATERVRLREVPDRRLPEGAAERGSGCSPVRPGSWPSFGRLGRPCRCGGWAPADHPPVEVLGDPKPVGHWLEHTRF